MVRSAGRSTHGLLVRVSDVMKVWGWGGHVKVPCASSCSEKKERKGLSTCSNDMNPKPTRNANFAKFSRENLVQFGLQKCMFRFGENVFF
jgi:hypothetical protein